ncbi:MAG: YeiH family protein [Oscillospiraceae bacterium]|nr:YeiH family protein [Oscillospiraceae bacterium]
MAASKWYHIIPGIMLCFVLAVPSWLLGKTFPIIGGPVFAIVIGILISLFFPKLTVYKFKKTLTFEHGVKYTSKKLLQYSIVLLGFEMNLYNVINVGGQSLLVMLFTLSAAFLTAFFVGKALKLPGDATTLIGVGTSICGGSAIAATAPIIRAKDEDVSQAISTIFLFNIIAVFIFPILGRLMHMSDIGFGMWAGTAVNDTSSVVAAGTSWSNAVGNNTALQFATIVKLTRTLMIVPVTLALAVYTTRKRDRKIEQDGGGNFSFVKVFPWFVIFFVIAAVLNTFAGIPAQWSSVLTEIGKFVIIMAMGAIGLNTNLKKLVSNGIKPILLGLSCWFAVAAVSLIVQNVMGI